MMRRATVAASAGIHGLVLSARARRATPRMRATVPRMPKYQASPASTVCSPAMPIANAANRARVPRHGVRGRCRSDMGLRVVGEVGDGEPHVDGVIVGEDLDAGVAGCGEGLGDGVTAGGDDEGDGAVVVCPVGGELVDDVGFGVGEEGEDGAECAARFGAEAELVLAPGLVAEFDGGEALQ